MPASELTKRVLFAVLAIPVVIGAVIFGDAALAALLAIAAALGAGEFGRIARASGIAPLDWLCIGLAAITPLAVHAIYRGLFHPPFTLVVLLVLVALSAVVFTRAPTEHPIAAAALTALGALYTGGLLSYAYALRYHEYAVGRAAGSTVLLLPLVLTWTSDTGAYFVGRSIGRHKLIPSVSPGKTVEGAIGALVLCAIVSWLYTRHLMPRVAQLAFAPGPAILFGLAVSVAAQLGDLVESLFKREGGVKDSSHLIPGHGGVLDRVDGMLFALPVAYLLFGLLVIPVPGGLR